MNTVHAHIPFFLKNHFNITIPFNPSVLIEVSSIAWQELCAIPNVFQPGFRKTTRLSGSAKKGPTGQFHYNIKAVPLQAWTGPQGSRRLRLI
jgi:hypothetical protein